MKYKTDHREKTDNPLAWEEWKKKRKRKEGRKGGRKIMKDK